MRGTYPQICLVAAGAMFFSWLVWPIYDIRQRSRSDGPSVELRNPIDIPPTVAPIYDPETPQGRLVARILKQPPPVPISGSSLAHLARLYDEVDAGDLGVANPLGIMTTASLARLHVGDTPLIATRDGVRYHLSSRASGPRHGESHRDLFLATFAQAQLPLSHSITTDDYTLAISDLIRDSIAHFRLDQKELSWTAIAYTHYLAPRHQWTNRELQRFTFDELCAELMQRPLADALLFVECCSRLRTHKPIRGRRTTFGTEGMHR